MCFSATASFAATGVTAVAGTAAVASSRRPAHILLASIPLIFAAHQFAEGVLWLSLSDGAHAAWRAPATYVFLTFGEVVWPFWVPLAILALEGDPRRRKVLVVLLGLGIIVAAARAIGLAAYPVSSAIVGHHIQYRLDQPWVLRHPFDVLYVVALVLPPFVPTSRLLRGLGVAILVSLVVSRVFYYETFISVWCFFAALISALVVVVLRRGAAGGLSAAPSRAARRSA